MPHPPRRDVPSTYRLRVDGHLDQHWSSWFGDLTLTHEVDGTTCLTAAVADQSQLHGRHQRPPDDDLTARRCHLAASCAWLTGTGSALIHPTGSHARRPPPLRVCPSTPHPA